MDRQTRDQRLETGDWRPQANKGAYYCAFLVGLMILAFGMPAGNTAVTVSNSTIKTAAAVVKKAVTGLQNTAALVGSEGVRNVSESKAMTTAPQATTVGEVPILRTMEKVKGEVTGIGSSTISVLYDSRGNGSEFEMVSPLSKGMKFEGYQKLQDIQMGDRVEIDYEKTVQYPKAPNERISSVTKVIRLIQKASKEEAPQ